jgi:hypothetical protein
LEIREGVKSKKANGNLRTLNGGAPPRVGSAHCAMFPEPVSEGIFVHFAGGDREYRQGRIDL